jgi:hypothetical protein
VVDFSLTRWLSRPPEILQFLRIEERTYSDNEMIFYFEGDHSYWGSVEQPQDCYVAVGPHDPPFWRLSINKHGAGATPDCETPTAVCLWGRGQPGPDLRNNLGVVGQVAMIAAANDEHI